MKKKMYLPAIMLLAVIALLMTACPALEDDSSTGSTNSSSNSAGTGTGTDDGTTLGGTGSGEAGSGQVTGGSSEAGSSEAGSSEAGSSEAGSSEAGSSEAGSSEAGSSEAGSSEAGSSEAGSSEAGSSEAGSSEAGSSEAGSSEAGSSEAGSSEAGSSEAGNGSSGTVSGTVEENSEVTLEQSDGTTQTTTTDDEYTFENVPTGETTVTVTNENNGTTTTQTISVEENETTHVNPFGSTQEMDDSLTARVYEVLNQGSGTTTASIQTNSQLGDDFYAKEINIPTRGFESGFPGVTDRFEWFGVVYEGQIKAPVTGRYYFNLTCDDGAKLYIDNQVVVNADGLHAPTTYTGYVDLVAGQVYDFKLDYFQGPRYHIALVLEVKAPGETEMVPFSMTDFTD